jgi:hypothetical protein
MSSARDLEAEEARMATMPGWGAPESLSPSTKKGIIMSDPTPDTVQTEYPPITPVEKMTIAALLEAKERKRAADLARQAASRITVDGYMIQEAIGSTGGWELHPTAGQGRPWYLAAKEQAIAAIPRHRAYFAKVQDRLGLAF